MEKQTPHRYVSSTSKPPKRHAQRKNLAITPKRKRPKVIFKRTLKPKKLTLYRNFKKTSKEYCTALLKSSLNRVAETHSQNLARLRASPIPIAPTSPSPLVPVIAASRSTAHLSSSPLSSLPPSPSVSPVKTNTGKDSLRETFSANDINLTTTTTTPTYKSVNNSTALTSFKKLIQPLSIPNLDPTNASKSTHNTENYTFSTSSSSSSTPSSILTLNHKITSFTHFLAAKEAELNTLWHAWDDNTRQIQALVEEARSSAGGDVCTDDPAKQPISPCAAPDTAADTAADTAPAALAVLAARVEQIGADAVSAMQAEVEDQQARRRAVRERMLEVLRDGMMGA